MSKNSFKIRNYHRDDFDSYVRLHSETNKYDRSERAISKQSLAENLGHPSYHPERNLFLAERAGSIIGYAGVFIETAIKRAILQCMVHPLHRKKGIATVLIQRAIQHAEKAQSKVMQVCVPQTNLPAKNFASHLDFKFIRCFYEFKLDLNRIRQPEVEQPDYIIRPLGPDEADRLTRVQNRSFANSWGFNPNTQGEIEYRINLSSCSPENIMMAYRHNHPIGYCWTRFMNEKDPADGGLEGEIHMLGVDPEYRRRGIGRSVLLAGLADLKNKGVAMAHLTADSDDPAAIGLYESVGFEVRSRTEWYEKILS
jgi:mycothiol synthase